MWKIVEKKFNPVHQHDVHEFLIYMLTNISEELTPKQDLGATLSMDRVEKLPAEEYWAYHCKRNPSVIDKAYQGL